MPVVYVTNWHSDHDYGPASEFGTLTPITSGNYPVFKMARLLEELSDNLAHSTEHDFLLFSGSSAIAAFAIVVWLSMHPHVNLLLHEKTLGRSRYVVRTLEKRDALKAVEEARQRKEAASGKSARKGRVS